MTSQWGSLGKTKPKKKNSSFRTSLNSVNDLTACLRKVRYAVSVWPSLTSTARLEEFGAYQSLLAEVIQVGWANQPNPNRTWMWKEASAQKVGWLLPLSPVCDPMCPLCPTGPDGKLQCWPRTAPWWVTKTQSTPIECVGLAWHLFQGNYQKMKIKGWPFLHVSP